MFKIISLLVASAAFLTEVTAHPGVGHTEEIARRDAYFDTLQRKDISHCASHLAARGLDKKISARREAKIQALRAKRGLHKRDIEDVLNTNHHSNLTGITPDVDPDTIFTGNSSCILSPDVTEGPYYVAGELVREDITDDEPGVDLALDIQVLDINTCEPVPDIYFDLWHCNATGVYGGVVANGNGNGDDSNLDNTMLRGIQLTDEDGVLQFDTIVPGHYTGRTNHIHLMGHLDATLLANNTIQGGTVPHVGQIFFDQSLLDEVETVSPYSSNTQSITTNEQDGIMAQEAERGDPVVEYVYLGDDVSEGLFGWIAFAIDTTQELDVSPAASYASDGGHTLSGGGGGPGGPPTAAVEARATPA